VGKDIIYFSKMLNKIGKEFSKNHESLVWKESFNKYK
jgi:hypothetical protein